MQVGDRVYYTDNGPEDQGTVLEVGTVGTVRVKFDSEGVIDPEDDWYSQSQITLIK